jgi:hypothetical protein
LWINEARKRFRLLRGDKNEAASWVIGWLGGRWNGVRRLADRFRQLNLT